VFPRFKLKNIFEIVGVHRFLSARRRVRDAHPAALKLSWNLLMIIGYKALVIFSKSIKQSFYLI